MDGKQTNNREARANHCPAWGKTCNTCKKDNHFTKACGGDTKKKQLRGGGGQKNPQTEKKTPVTEGQETSETKPAGAGAGTIYSQLIDSTNTLPNGWDRGAAAGATVSFDRETPQNSEPLNWADDQEYRSDEEQQSPGNAQGEE